ncbi:RIKEN cDNA D030056L22, isoform CRA_a [Mus musculus]|nr:RIKEN cDNA D030056L22, isoform CRA_a [Mus musculus]
MAKRRAAEPLTFRVPWKRLLLSDFPEEPPLWQPEEFWQYNTFQYWRNPLPPLDLAALEDVSANSLTETLEDKNEGVEIDMES